MAIAADLIISYDVQDLQTISILDASVCTAPDNIASINGVRLLFSTVNSVAQASQAETCLAWYEYEVLTGTAIANGVSYAVGSTMLFAADTTPSGTFTMQTSGRYSQYISDTLPSSGNFYTFTPSQIGRETLDGLYFQDEIVTVDYEIYTTIETSTISTAGTYLCVGTDGDSVLIDSAKTIYVGETFVATGGESFSGAPTMVLQYDSTSASFATKYESFLIYESYLEAKSQAVAPNEKLDSNLLAVAALYASTDIAADTTSGIGLTQLQDNLNKILNYYSINV
jgi:hypothetical protein